MELILATKQDYKYLRKLYREAFPIAERAPFFLLLQGTKGGYGQFWCLKDKGIPLGMAYMVSDAELAYVFYLAIEKESRSNGYGHVLMSELLKHYEGKKFFLALEDANDKTASNYEQRLERHGFYESCGLSDLSGKIKEGSITFAIMGNALSVEPEEYEKLIVNWSGRFWQKLFDMHVIK